MQIQIKHASINLVVRWEEYSGYAILSISHYTSRYDYFTHQLSECELRILPNADEEDTIDKTNVNIILLPDEIEKNKFNFITSYYNRDKETEEFLFLIKPPFYCSLRQFSCISSKTYTNVQSFKDEPAWQDSSIFFDTEV